MDFSNRDWTSVPPKEFSRFLSSCNPLREAWSNGEVLYEYQGSEKRVLGFVDLNGFVRVPPDVHHKYFS